MRRRDIVDGEYRLGARLFLLLDLGLLGAAEVAENVAQVQKTDGRLSAFLPAALLFLFLLFCLRLVLVTGLILVRRLFHTGRRRLYRRFVLCRRSGLRILGRIHNRRVCVRCPRAAREEGIVLHKERIVKDALEIDLAGLVYCLLHAFRAEPEPAGQIDHLAGLLFRASAHEAVLPRSAFMSIRIVCHILSSLYSLSPKPYG